MTNYEFKLIDRKKLRLIAQNIEIVKSLLNAVLER
jgi:hypothetical protein